MTDRILVVDDDPDQCAAFQLALRELGYEVETTTDPRAALDLTRDRAYQAVLTDLEMPTVSGIELCGALASACPATPVLVVTGYPTVDNVTAAFHAGAYDYLCKPVELRDLTLRLTSATRDGSIRHELKRAEDLLDSRDLPAIRGRSPLIKRVRGLVKRVAPSDASVLLRGETGTGKELVARTLHAQSRRAAGPFVAINCAAIPATLLESELFGHVRGAFTDAKHDRSGLFTEAHGGTLFLDEVDGLSLSMQSKLLRALQERFVRPVGAQHEVPFDVRLVTATHRDLDHAASRNQFLESLLYRINVVRLELPALRDRREDILELALEFLRRIGDSERAQRAPRTLSIHAAEALVSYDFPGNVRELENCMRRAHAVSRYDSVQVEDLPESVQSSYAQELRSMEGILTVDELTKRHVRKVMSLLGGNKSRASRLLGVDRRTLARKI